MRNKNEDKNKKVHESGEGGEGDRNQEVEYLGPTSC
jgi:hypothetical protein